MYGIDPQVLRQKISQDKINAIVLARRDNPGAFPDFARPRHPPHGPRTRREYLAFLRWSGEA
ncbi:MAG: hypothetical protein ABIS92_14300 [Polyangia bacterium]